MLGQSALIEDLIADLAEVLEIPPERYESAERSYKSVGKWLNRPESAFARVNVNVYTQGSFRLGTAIRPVNGEEHYDLDIVCEMSLSKSNVTQKQLHSALGRELQSYAQAHGMETPSAWDRCWTMNYADSAQFHMDVLPSVPDEQRQRRLREQMKVSAAFVQTSVAITDSNHPNYARVSEDWPVSNPNGYATWFYERMRPAFEMRRKAMMLRDKLASVSEIPEFRVKTPLQAAIQILKRHRDLRFEEEPEFRSNSIVITTLAAHSYQQEATIFGALDSILSRMGSFVENRGGKHWIPNPTDPRENFADAWNVEPGKREAFFDWLETAQADFRNAAETDDILEFMRALAPRMGRQIIEAAIAKRKRPMLKQGALLPLTGMKAALQRILDAPHRRPPTWRKISAGKVWFESANAHRFGFRTINLLNDGSAVPVGHELTFVCKTDVNTPFEVYWQVVNTGEAARMAHNLRGRFEKSNLDSSSLKTSQDAKYPGTHSIECFVIKDSYCVASTGPLIVKIVDDNKLSWI